MILPYLTDQANNVSPVDGPKLAPGRLLARIEEGEFNSASGTNPMLQLAVLDPRNRLTKSYGDLRHDLSALARILAPLSSTWAAERVLNLLPAGYGWIVSQLALWSLKAINVPQPVQQPLPELKHVVRCAGIRIGLGTEPSLDTLHRLGLDLVVILSPDGLRVITVAQSSKSTILLPRAPPTTDGAMMLFTSGTTGQPKGVLMTHSAIAHQCMSLGEAWQWDSDDRVLHTLPLTHIHGIINALAVPLWHGSTIEFSSSHAFLPADVWDRFLAAKQPPITVFMAVPTMYSRLLRHYRTAIDEKAATTRRACGRTRLMLSGSAPLSARLKSDWLQLTGHVLLERYGMTETGMVLSNPLLGERHDGHVGFPLPGMLVRLRDQSTGEIIGLRELEKSGELEVKGGSVFEGYWSMSEQRCIKDGAFTNDGYFRTGDIAQRSVLGGSYQLLGRSSTDIIKSGGEKVSALELEQVVGRLAGVAEVSVVGLPDEEWGETVGCVLVLEGPEAKMLGDVRHLRAKLKTELAPYKLPKVVKVYEGEIPRNMMGKVQKLHLARVAFPERFCDK